MSYKASSSQRTPAQRAYYGNDAQQFPTPQETPTLSRVQAYYQPQTQYQEQRQYMSYPSLNTAQQPPTPYQSNGSRRRMTQAELQMAHGIDWLGYGAVIPNVSVVTGGPLLDRPLNTHGTRVVGGKRNYKDEFDDNCDLASRVASCLTIAINRNARQER
jgi:hypothetical protein